MPLSNITIFHHKEHKDWLSKIDFYQDQIKVFQKELVLVLHGHSDLFSIIEHVDEYRAILLKKLQKLDEFRRQIILHEKVLSQNIKNTNTDAIDLWDHYEIRQMLSDFENNYEKLKVNFRKFVSHQI